MIWMKAVKNKIINSKNPSLIILDVKLDKRKSLKSLARKLIKLILLKYI